MPKSTIHKHQGRDSVKVVIAPEDKKVKVLKDGKTRMVRVGDLEDHLKP